MGAEGGLKLTIPESVPEAGAEVVGEAVDSTGAGGVAGGWPPTASGGNSAVIGAV